MQPDPAASTATGGTSRDAPASMASPVNNSSNSNSSNGKGKERMHEAAHDADNETEALMREISAKKAQIVHGFPLASMAGGVAGGGWACCLNAMDLTLHF